MGNVVISQFVPDEWETLRGLRLEALTLNPAFFAADPDYEAKLTESQWRDNIAARHWLVARVDGEIAGLCAFSRIIHTKKQAHTGTLGAMYVRDAFRGAGVADALVEALIDIAMTCVGQVSLTVNAENQRAIKFYERHGFRKYGVVPRALNIDGRYYDDMEMMRIVSSSD